MNTDYQTQLTEWLYQACLVEVLCAKPGNVSPGNAFRNANVNDFLLSARVSAPCVARAGSTGVGRAIYDAAQATHEAVGHNTNLGILLLLSPMAAVPGHTGLAGGLPEVLRSLSIEDADWTYQAIRIADPGGLGASDKQDIHAAPTETLLQCMRLAAERDLIARQYNTDFHDVLLLGVDLLKESSSVVLEPQRIGWLALRLMSRFGDTLVARKCGIAFSHDLQHRATAVLTAGWPHAENSRQAWNEFDSWLRSDGNRLNPGTTADMIAAIVFAALRSGQYTTPPELLQFSQQQDLS